MPSTTLAGALFVTKIQVLIVLAPLAVARPAALTLADTLGWDLLKVQHKEDNSSNAQVSSDKQGCQSDLQAWPHIPGACLYYPCNTRVPAQQP